MNINILKAFIKPLKNRGYIQRYIVKKTQKKHKNMRFMSLPYEDMFTYDNGVIIFWYDKPLGDIMTTGAACFKSIDYYKKHFLKNLKKIWRKYYGSKNRY